MGRVVIVRPPLQESGTITMVTFLSSSKHLKLLWIWPTAQDQECRESRQRFAEFQLYFCFLVNNEESRTEIL